MMATLTIQLPSNFSGGELVVRHNGMEEVYDSGAGDGSCEYNSDYSCFYADVEHELKPLTGGYRIALVYSLSWVGAGVEPSVTGNAAPALANALKEHSEKSSPGKWTLQFGLDHSYTAASLSRFGVRALKRTDRNRVDGLLAAGRMAEMGCLEVAICKLKRLDCYDSHGDEIYSCRIDVTDLYDADVRVIPAKTLNFLYWG